jgi:hypothetical protein
MIIKNFFYGIFSFLLIYIQHEIQSSYIENIKNKGELITPKKQMQPHKFERENF